MNYNIINKKNKRKGFLKQLFAVVNPEYLKKISSILKRELIAEKDTEDYNNSMVSSYFDKTSVLLREVGQSKINPGDSYKLLEYISSVEQDREDLLGFYENKTSVNTYDFFPFDKKLGQEIRSHFILKTKKDDSFEQLMDELDGLIFKFLSINDWTILKNAIKKSESRFKNIRFLQPETFIGMTQEKLLYSEAKRNNISDYESLSVDVRKDTHDLLSLKEFLSMVKGEEIIPLTIGPGFFSKYMPELKSLGVYGLIFKVTDNKLTEIKLIKSQKAVDVEFSPISASIGLIETYCYEEKKGFFSTFKKYNIDKIIDESIKYYVVVDGCVSAPENLESTGYEQLSKNSIKIPSGEVILFETVGEEIQSTRLYFTPYDYSKLNLCHQHGSVIFGNNDQSFNSCVLDSNAFFDNNSIIDFIEEVQKNNKLLYDPAFIAIILNCFPEKTNPDILLNSENRDLLLSAFGSMFEETGFSIKYLIKEFVELPKEGQDSLSICLKNYAPIHKRFILGKYFTDNHGLVLEKNKTTYILLSEKIYYDSQINLMNESIRKK